ncbi:MAG: response regulator transcription factor [Actinomycetaceae bacterium]|nr:response regulator transcription factor [Arcanobacterium sp.]MDD7504955.1 response regulator transcription factor [Actinomycetaceae bacterium]MDY6143706.1 response regulator transcription factor [Arcanobacterium sp.]
MPVLDGVQTAERIILSHPEVVVVMLIAFEQDDYLSRALTLDIGGFLTKDMSGEQLGESIKQAYCGQKVFGPQPTSVLIESYRSVASAASEFAEFKDAVEKLPDYLRHVFDLLITGLPYKSIARRLSLSDTTVRSYISDIYSATGFTNRAELTIVAIRAGF